MKRLISTKNLSKSEWLRYRKRGITGTDAGAITGMNPYKSAFAVYQDKISYDTDDVDNESMRQGRDFEDYVAKRFAEETGKEVRRANAIYYNESHSILLADFDRLIVGEKAGLECKTVSPYLADRWDNGDIPLHYQMQVQHYLAVSGYDHWYIAALVFGKDFIIRRINRDEELISDLITIEQTFWNEHVVKGIAPSPDGTDSCSKLIAKLYSKADKGKTIILDGFNDSLDRREEIESQIKALESEKNLIDQKIKLEMKDATFADTSRFRISWVPYTTTRLDSKLLKSKEPELYDKYSKTTDGRRFSVNPAA